MALPETRFQFRVQLSDTDRRVDANQTITVLLHPSETLERMYTRLIAWALWWTPELKFGPGLSDPDAPALEALDLTMRRTIWISVDPPSAEKVNWSVRHNHGAQVGAAFSGAAAWNRFVEGSRTIKGTDTVEIARMDEAMIAAMAEELQERRYDASITIVEGHLYLDVGGKSFDGAVERFVGLPHGLLQT